MKRAKDTVEAAEAMKAKTGVPFRLAVALIIAALVLIYVFAPRRHRGEIGRRVTCGHNLKQIGLGIAQYYDDNGKMPRMERIQHLAADIAPYINNSPKLFVCPYDTTIRPAADISNVTESSYAIVINAVWQTEPMTPLLFDKLHPTGLTVLTGSNTWSPQSAHKDGGNVLWTDGHVDWNKSLDVGTNRYPVVND
jgi:prepilin-type processing-associated H-X9-DG protein